MEGRAEHKVEDGKLLRADVRFDDEIEDVELHGDFFVYPEEALDTIEAAMEGFDVAVDRDTLSARIEQALDRGTRLVGFSPENAAAVVTEAMNGGD